MADRLPNTWLMKLINSSLAAPSLWKKKKKKKRERYEDENKRRTCGKEDTKIENELVNKPGRGGQLHSDRLVVDAHHLRLACSRLGAYDQPKGVDVRQV